RSETPGTVTVYGTPAEVLASPAAKTVMYTAGVFKGADVMVRSHSSTATQTPAPGFGSCCMNIDVVHYTFSGAPAHQLQAWDGRDALMGVIELFNHIDGLRKTLRPETKIQGIITEGGRAPNVVPDRAAAEFWIRYPDPIYLAQVLDRVNDAARGAALATGTKVHIDVDSSSRNGISVAALNDVAFAYLKQLGATKVEPEPGRPLPYEETGTVATQIPGVGVTVHSSNGGYHTFEMEADALGEVGHHGFLLDAQAMAALLYHYASDAPYRAVVLLLIVANAVQNAMVGPDTSLAGGLVAAAVLLAWHQGIDRLRRSSRHLGRLLGGSADLLVYHGRVLHQHLARENLTVDELR